jgi:hypothetical protein
MNENSNVFLLRRPDEIDDPLTNILRSGARQLLARAIELEAEVFLAWMKDLRPRPCCAAWSRPCADIRVTTRGGRHPKSVDAIALIV